jgi:ankyrin repeat protein
MFIASREGHLDLAKYLVHNLSNVNQKNNSGYTSLHYGNKYYINN